jgi:hypothetical protein
MDKNSTLKVGSPQSHYSTQNQELHNESALRELQAIDLFTLLPRMARIQAYERRRRGNRTRRLFRFIPSPRP